MTGMDYMEWTIRSGLARFELDFEPESRIQDVFDLLRRDSKPVCVPFKVVPCQLERRRFTLWGVSREQNRTLSCWYFKTALGKVWTLPHELSPKMKRRSPSRYRPSISDVIVHWNWHVLVIICVCIVAQPSLLAQTVGVDAMMIQGKVWRPGRYCWAGPGNEANCWLQQYILVSQATPFAERGRVWSRYNYRVVAEESNYLAVR